MAKMDSFGLVLLAAGESHRMGRPKQLLPLGGRTLIRHAAEAALASSANPVIVVLGANASEIRPSLDGLAVQVVVNGRWTEGMASSIRVGIEQLVSFVPGTAGVMIALADQPGFSARHIDLLLEAHRTTGRGIIASQYGGKAMPPAFFVSNYFSSLLKLHGDAGARSLFQAHANDLATVEGGNLGDLDTPSDYADYLKQIRVDKRQ